MLSLIDITLTGGSASVASTSKIRLLGAIFDSTSATWGKLVKTGAWLFRITVNSQVRGETDLKPPPSTKLIVNCKIYLSFKNKSLNFIT